MIVGKLIDQVARSVRMSPRVNEVSKVVALRTAMIECHEAFLDLTQGLGSVDEWGQCVASLHEASFDMGISFEIFAPGAADLSAAYQALEVDTWVGRSGLTEVDDASTQAKRSGVDVSSFEETIDALDAYNRETFDPEEVSREYNRWHRR